MSQWFSLVELSKHVYLLCINQSGQHSLENGTPHKLTLISASLPGSTLLDSDPHR